ncbi:Phospholipase/carboxylesterase [Russula earlei]|uniref:Phospholipase/carboxylesterase n=1 Tax=Russula earlei TaxID=71964 RepID=A0ACC0UDP7_9AGAM|nr:Phospholipase/carboxylesterase [Russula earlei]
MLTSNPLRISASAQQTATVIFLHGLGQTNVGWHNRIRWMATQLPNIEWVLPQAPTRPVSLNGGQHRSSWFNIQSLPPSCNEWDEAAMASSISGVEAWIQAEVHRGTDPHRIVLMGFSQGAALSLLVALTTLHELGGVISLAGWIPHRGREQIVHTEPYLPIFCGHGRSDCEIPTYYSEEAMAFLRDVLRLPTGFLTFKRYEGLPHAVNSAEMYDVVIWLQSVLHLLPIANEM